MLKWSSLWFNVTRHNERVEVTPCDETTFVSSGKLTTVPFVTIPVALKKPDGVIFEIHVKLLILNIF